MCYNADIGGSMLFRLIRNTILLTAVLCGISQASALPTRAMSLNAAVAAMRSGYMAEQAESLCGITKVSGYIVDSKSKDIVIIGKPDPTLPSLHIDDFVVALRNVWYLYAKTKGQTIYYTDPGCSIDPDPHVMGQLRDLRRTPFDVNNPTEMKNQTDQWNQIGKHPQTVRVLGVPFDSHFAKIMVDADYYMKRLVNGTVTLPINGFQSLSDLDTQSIRASLHSKDESTRPTSSINRFWFSPGDCTYTDGSGYVLLKSCDVKLLTEEQFLNEQGAMAGKGRPDPLADQFARSFSQNYGEIAAQRRIYRELQGLFAFVGLARLMKDHNAESAAHGAMKYLLNSYKLPTVSVNRRVNGLTDIRTVSEQMDSPRGQQTITVVLSSCGGVSMNVHPKRAAVSGQPRNANVASASDTGRPNVHRGKSATATRTTKPRATNDVRSTVLNSKRSPHALSWDIPAQFD